MNKEDNLSQEEIQLFKELMFQCDLKKQNKVGLTPLLYAFIYNQLENLYLNQKQFDYLIKNNDLKQKDKYSFTPLMYALKSNQLENLNLSEEQLDYLIKNSDLSQQNKDGLTPLIYALFNNKEQNLQLKTKQFKIMYDAIDTEQQQINFQKLIQEHVKNNYQYLDEINFLLYNCEFKPNEETINYLKENHQNIIKMIEKRDLLFQLNQDVKEIDNDQKYNKVKI